MLIVNMLIVNMLVVIMADIRYPAHKWMLRLHSMHILQTI